jgi:hypothetical protein
MTSNDQAADRPFICEFCRKTFTCIGNLNRHVKTSKLCLESRGIDSASERCADCGYTSASTFNYERHLGSCRRRKIRLDKERDDEKKEFENRIIKLEAEKNLMKEQLSAESSQPRIVNNQFNITFNLQLEHSQRILSPYSTLEKAQTKLLWAEFTRPAFERGLKGLARIINNKLLTHEGKKWIISYEPNKQVFHRKNDKEEIEIDDRAEAFLESLMPTIKVLVQRHISDLLQESDGEDSAFAHVSKLKGIFFPVFERGTPERKKIVRMIADNACTSRASLISAKSKSENEYKTVTGPKIEFCDILPEEKSNEWFASSDPDYLSWKADKYSFSSV